MLGSADYTASNGLTVVLASGATAGDLVEVISMQVSSVLNAIPSTAGSVSTANIANGSVTPAKLSTGYPNWDTSGNLGVGTSSLTQVLNLYSSPASGSGVGTAIKITSDGSGGDNGFIGVNKGTGNGLTFGCENRAIIFQTGNTLPFNGTERMRIDTSGRVGVGCVPTGAAATEGVQLIPSGVAIFTRNADLGIFVNRLTNDGQLIQFRQDTVEEGNISVSGTTVSYNGGHLSRYAQTLTPMDASLLKGTVLSNLDEMNEYIDVDGNPVDNEQLNKVKVSDVEGDANVAGVFVNWSHDTPHDLDEINMAMTGDMIIRIAEGVTVQRGDLLMSAGDGTAKPQGDDIVRSKTVAKVTSTHITCTYEDGSYCVPCVLMAC
jgi:hypothetical protein